MEPELLWLSSTRQRSCIQPLAHGPRAGAPKRRELVGLWAPFAPDCSPDVVERSVTAGSEARAGGGPGGTGSVREGGIQHRSSSRKQIDKGHSNHRLGVAAWGHGGAAQRQADGGGLNGRSVDQAQVAQEA